MKRGFTLLELLIVITIIGIFSAISLGAMRNGGKSLALSRSVHALATEIRKSQEMAMAMKKISVATTSYLYVRNGITSGWQFPRCWCDFFSNLPNCPLSFPASQSDPDVCYDQFIALETLIVSYIFYKTTQTFPQGYGIYINKNPVTIYLFADTSSPYGQYNSGDIIVEDFCQSEKDICQGKINIVSFSPSGNELHIVFKPPYPTTVFYPSSSQVSITLGTGSMMKTIKVFKSGLISVE